MPNPVSSPREIQINWKFYSMSSVRGTSPNRGQRVSEAQAGVFQPRAIASVAADVQPISADDLIKGLGIQAPRTRSDHAVLLATILYCWGAAPDVAAKTYIAGPDNPNVESSAARNVEILKRNWLTRGGTAAGFNQSISAALVGAVANSEKDFPQIYEELTQKATADANRAFPHDIVMAGKEKSRLMRNSLWTELNHIPIPESVNDINQCRITLKAEVGGIEISGLIPRRNAANVNPKILFSGTPNQS
jgi:hypothetical protein